MTRAAILAAVALAALCLPAEARRHSATAPHHCRFGQIYRVSLGHCQPRPRVLTRAVRHVPRAYVGKRHASRPEPAEEPIRATKADRCIVVRREPPAADFAPFPWVGTLADRPKIEWMIQ